MQKFAANLSMLYPDLEFLDRFAAAARDRFNAVEFQFPYAFNVDDIAMRLRDNGLQQVLFNAPPGDWLNGERGTACLPGREQEFRAGIGQALGYAAVLRCPRIHVMAGAAPEGLARANLRAIYVERLGWAATEAAKQGVDILIEPINTRDIPRFFLNRQEDAHQIVKEVGASNLKVQMDLYHCQIVEGDVATKLKRYVPSGDVGHVQIAGVPERHEPDVGEMNYPYLFDVLDQVGYGGWIGCEYRPSAGMTPGGTSSRLGWLKAYQ
jgi:2-dehydrotetronate isomerase